MASVAGKNQSFEIESSPGSASFKTLDSNINSISFPRSVDTSEDTSLGDSAKSHVVTLSSATISLDGHWDAAGDRIDELIAANFAPSDGVSTAWKYYPEGNSATNVVYSGQGFVTSFEVSGGVDGLTEYSCELVVTGAITRGTV